MGEKRAIAVIENDTHPAGSAGPGSWTNDRHSTPLSLVANGQPMSPQRYSLLRSLLRHREESYSVQARGMELRELAWTAAGATIGGLVRYWAGRMWPGAGPAALASTVVLAVAAAALIGFALVASLRTPMKTALIAAGGAAGSISAAATQAASATPLQSIVGLAAFVLGAAAGLLLGMLVATTMPRNAQRKERR